jgi:peptidyl-prolyl cis-trans isomerase C
MMNHPHLALLTLLLSLLTAGCDRSPTKVTVDFRRTPPAGASQGTWVARFGTQTITEAELAARFAEMNPYARARFQTVEQRREYLDGLVRFELFAQEAVQRGLANDPEVVEAARRVMVQALLKREVDGSVDAITDAQVKTYYEAHAQDYVKPAMSRLAHIAFAKEDRAKAEATLEEARALPPLDFAAFGRLARERSADQRTRALDGDLRFLSDDELAKQYGPALVVAAGALAKVGDVAPTLVETEQALHVVKLQGRQIALNLSVDQAKPSIQQVLLNETKQERFRALLARLKQQADLQVNESALAAIVVDPKAPAVESKAPQAGFLPAPQEPAPTR